MKPRFDAVICDIDGCLGPESNEPLNLAALEQVARYNDRAGATPAITVCSGRPLPFAEAVCRMVRNTTLPAICENGVWLFDPAQNRYLRDPAIAPAHMHAVHEATEWIERELIPRGVVIQPGKSASISLWHPDTAFLRAQVPLLEGVFAERAWPFRVSMTVAWINCDLKHVSKSTGLRRFLEMTGLKRERLAGIGDSASDLVMLDHVSYFAAPSNAAPEVKARSHFVSAHAEIEGVLDILRRVSGE
jgi:hydroxymethylpyrimidine pyrophosphatase-like HAD family hydrolase